MNTHGKAETEKLKENLQDQLDRLVEQLADLESCKDSLDIKEYEETKEETMEQLKELNESLNRLLNGDISLVSKLGAMRMATQIAISEAFKTPEVIRFFGRREPESLRNTLTNYEQEYKMNKITIDSFNRHKAEILTALKQLGEEMTRDDLIFLEKHNDLSKVFKDIDFKAVKDED